jgi:hypothetical protein
MSRGYQQEKEERSLRETGGIATRTGIACKYIGSVIERGSGGRESSLR